MSSETEAKCVPLPIATCFASTERTALAVDHPEDRLSARPCCAFQRMKHGAIENIQQESQADGPV